LNDCEVDIAEMAIAEKLRHNAIVGSSEQMAARLKEFAKGLELDELVVVTWTYDPAPRHRSYELLAQAFGMDKTEAHTT
jgi:alkanesulfonate monooxygenase SsuD/methylene tetrahydromethanopterin reductase-like flavin-dependent oxidoreductase (luciferase family)